ncbi:MAG: alpha/beta fold hydrolase [Planctomycetota bacterium]|jgi:predicted esterase
MRFGLLLLLGAAVHAQGFDFPKKNPSRDLELGATYEGQSKSKRPYLYRLPAKIDKEAPPNLIFLLHGTGMSYKWGFANYGVHKGHFRKDDIVVSPESENSSSGFVQRKPDREEIAGFIKLFRKLWPIRNVYLYGHSQGAFFCYYFAGERPQLIDGIVAHAGNFFKAKTTKAAREKVAIGILHGRADAVVGVVCAYATDNVYRGAGYTKVKLYVVDGLNENTGHWPLPFQVGQMLDWCDLMSLKKPAEGAALAAREMTREKPDFVLVSQAAVRGKALGKDEGTDKLHQLVVEAALANAEALVAADRSSYGPWCAQLRLSQEAFAGLAEWKEAAKPLQSLLKKHTAQVEQGMKAIPKFNNSSFGGGLKAMEKGYVGDGYDHLAGHMQHWVNKQGDKVKAKDRERFKALQDGRRAADKEGRRAFEDLTKSKLAPLK